MSQIKFSQFSLARWSGQRYTVYDCSIAAKVLFSCFQECVDSFLLYHLFPQTMDLSLSQRLFLWVLAISVIAIVTVSFFYDREAESAVVQRSFDQLASVQALKKSKVQDYFESLRAMLSVLAAHPATVLTSAQEMSARYGVSEIMICSPSGKILYTFHETLTLDSQLDSVMLLAAKRITSAFHDTTTHFTDVLRFGNQCAAFGIIAIDSAAASTVSPFQRGNYILIQVPVQALNRIMNEREGLGTTGESYLVGADSLMRSESRFMTESTILRLPVKTEPVRRAFAGETGRVETTDYRNVKVLSAFAPLRIDRSDWAIISELDVEEITTPINAIRRHVMLVGLSITLLMTVVSWYGAQRLSTPILHLQSYLSAIAKGQIPEEPLQVKRSDEIGAMTAELNTMTDSLRKAAFFARDIGAGKFDAVFPPRSDADVLVIALNDMKQELENLLAEKQTQATHRTLALVEGEERERTRISRDVHDGVGQILTALKFNISRISDEQVRQELLDLANDAIAEVRAISHNLMPGVLVDFGLEAALEHLCKRLREIDGLSVDSEITPLPQRFDGPKEIAMYRIAQEAISNALRYAEARRIVVKLCLEQSQHSNSKIVILSVSDDGKGFNADFATDTQPHYGNGLVNMRERAALFGGDVHIHSTIRSGESRNNEPSGTEVVVKMPFFLPTSSQEL